MKSLFFIFFLLVSNCVNSEWLKLDNVFDGKNEWYVDTKPNWNGKNLQVWVKINYNPPVVNQTTKSTRHLKEFNCHNSTWRNVWITAFSEYDLNGEVLIDFAPKTEWIPIPPETFGSFIKNNFCKK